MAYYIALEHALKRGEGHGNLALLGELFLTTHRKRKGVIHGIDREKLRRAVEAAAGELREDQMHGREPIGFIELWAFEKKARDLFPDSRVIEVGVTAPFGIRRNGDHVAPRFPSFAGLGIARRAVHRLLKHLNAHVGRKNEEERHGVVFAGTRHEASTYFGKSVIQPGRLYPFDEFLGRLGVRRNRP